MKSKKSSTESDLKIIKKFFSRSLLSAFTLGIFYSLYKRDWQGTIFAFHLGFLLGLLFRADSFLKGRFSIETAKQEWKLSLISIKNAFLAIKTTLKGLSTDGKIEDIKKNFSKYNREIKAAKEEFTEVEIGPLAYSFIVGMTFMSFGGLAGIVGISPLESFKLGIAINMAGGFLFGKGLGYLVYYVKAFLNKLPLWMKVGAFPLSYLLFYIFCYLNFGSKFGDLWWLGLIVILLVSQVIYTNLKKLKEKNSQ